MVLHLLKPKRFDFQKYCIFSRLCVSGYAKKIGVGGKAGAAKKKAELPVETDPAKLCTTLCGGNIHKEGEDPVLKPDKEYPDWLWELRLDRTSPDLSELDPETPQYWRKLKKQNMVQNNLQQKLRARR